MADHNQAREEDPQEETFIERSAVSKGVNAAAMSAGAGLLVSAVQNSLVRHDKGAIGVFTRSGTTIGIFSERGSESSRRKSAD